MKQTESISIKPLWIAVVYRRGGSQRTDKSFTCWVGNNKKEIEKKALDAKKAWGIAMSCEYVVLVGQLSSTAKLPIDKDDKFNPLKPFIDALTLGEISPLRKK